MYNYIYSGAIVGIDSVLVKVEVDVSPGLPCFEMVGMLNSEVKEAKERVRVALKNNGIFLPPHRITVNISPANIRKSGTVFDLPIAIAILMCVGEVEVENVDKILMVGELGLNGELLFGNGILPIVLEARLKGIEMCIVPKQNECEAAMVEGMKIVGLDNISEVLQYLKTEENERNLKWPPCKRKFSEETLQDYLGEIPDFSEISGQKAMKRAAEIAASGFHHMLMVGPPGAGKSMIAKRIPYILPPLTMEESLEVSKIYSVIGKLDSEHCLITKRPFCSPHHTISAQAMAGGGRIPKPGALSLSHRGVLFLDEAVHFSSQSIETLRQPLEDKKIEISRSYGSFVYPADFMLIAAINPCPCGFYPDRNKCNCTDSEIKRYLSKISGPILDRIDLCVEASRIEMSELEINGQEESTREIRERIMKAREIQLNRFRGTNLKFNSQMGPKEIAMYCQLGKREHVFAEKVYSALQLSARSYHKLLRVARTIADLDGNEVITESNLAEAVSFRTNGKLFE